MSETLSTFEFFQKSSNEEAARAFFETRHWVGEASCGHCGSVRASDVTPVMWSMSVTSISASTSTSFIASIYK